MKVCVLGCARSGTSAIYHLLQHILSDRIPKDVDFVYEPFLWNRDSFNKMYTDITKEFKGDKNISVVGINSHLKLPLFITSAEEYMDDQYIKSLFRPSEQGQDLLVKFIRANGRYRLLSQLEPEMKFVLVVRNPVDVINSVVGKFSLFGVEYHEDDYTRFVVEIDEKLGGAQEHQADLGEVDKAALYWRYMNEFMFDSVSKASVRPYTVCLEQYRDSPDIVIRGLCKYLGIRFSEEYVELSRRTVGPVTGRSHITQDDYDRILPVVDEYIAMLEKNTVSFPKDVKKSVEAKYSRLFSQTIADEKKKGVTNTISIVTPSYNYAEFIGETIASVLKQKGKNFYIDYVIVDGASTDGTVEIIKHYEKLLRDNCTTVERGGMSYYVPQNEFFEYNQCKGISYRWISEPDGGHGSALNKGFSMTVGNLMAWINSDDKYHPGAFQVVSKIFDSHKDVDWIIGKYTWWNKEGECTRQEARYMNIYDYLLGNWKIIQQESVFWTDRLWNKAGSHISENMELMVDGELWGRFFGHAQLYQVDKALSGFRRHDNNRAHNNRPTVEREMNWVVKSLKRKTTLSREIDYLTIVRKSGRWVKQIKPNNKYAILIDEIEKKNVTIKKQKRRIAKLKAKLKEKS